MDASGCVRFPFMLFGRLARRSRFAKCVLCAMLMWPLLSFPADFLEPEAAFRFSARMIDANTAEVSYAIADGYYMYRERFSFRTEGAKLGTPVFPAGETKFDDTFRKSVEIFHRSVRIRIPVATPGSFTLIATAQGCAEKGLCYSPMESRIDLNPVSAASSGPTAPRSVLPQAAKPASSNTDIPSDAGMFQAAIEGGNLLVALPLFFLAGLALSLTPCVLPMVPILSSIIVGEGSAVTRRRGFMLSAAYASGMALVYTGMGMVAGWLGEGLAASFQNPWMLGLFGLLMAGLALSMFDVFQLQLPTSIQTRLTQASNRQSTGKLAGVFLMGALSGLLVGPCVAAPLLGVLVFISRTHDVVLGGSALFSMTAGMSVPLLVVGVSAGWLLPRAGVWMDAIKRLFGVLLLGVAWWLISPLLPAIVQMLGWFALLGGYGSYLLAATRLGTLSRVLGMLFVLAGLAELAGVLTGGRDAIAPLAHLRTQPGNPVKFTRVATAAQLDSLLAQKPGKPAMLDFYADWCTACKEMEQRTFSDARVRGRLAGMVLLRADVTANSADDKALLRRFHLFGPPGIIFFDGSGHEIEGARVIGFQEPVEFMASLGRRCSGNLASHEVASGGPDHAC